MKTRLQHSVLKLSNFSWLLQCKLLLCKLLLALVWGQNVPKRVASCSNELNGKLQKIWSVTYTYWLSLSLTVN